MWVNLTKGLIVLTILIAVGIGFYAFSATKSLTSSPTPLASSSPTSSSNPQMSPEETAQEFDAQTEGWKTYTNDKSKISFKYPTKAGLTSVPVVKTTGTGTQVSIQTTGLEFMLIIQPIQTGASKYYGNSEFLAISTINSLDWDVSASSGICDQNNCGKPFLAFQTTKNNTQYIFVFSEAKEKSELQQVIVSTFKFLE